MQAHRIIATGRAGARLSSFRSSFLELRKRHDASELTPGTSLELMRAGNHVHSALLSFCSVAPAARRKLLNEGRADGLIVACSDSRMHRFDRENSKSVFVQLRLAGNVVSFTYPEFADALRHVRQNGFVIVEGHEHCGAVKAYSEWEQGGKKRNGIKQVISLLREIKGNTPGLNAIHQCELPRSPAGSRVPIPMVYGWGQGTGSISLCKPGMSGAGNVLKQLNHLGLTGPSDPKLFASMEKQAPHVIAISPVDMPFGIATVLHARQNEVFAVTGAKSGLSDLSLASVIYAVQHLGVKHISLIAPLAGDNALDVRGMFGQWLDALCSVSVLREASAVVTQLKYCLENGRIAEFNGKTTRL